MAINFVKNDDIRILRDIEQYYSTQIDEMPMNGKLPFVNLLSEYLIDNVDMFSIAVLVQTTTCKCSVLFQPYTGFTDLWPNRPGVLLQKQALTLDGCH